MNSAINYPPKELLKPFLGKRKFELIILWMLYNNEFCTWGDLQHKIAKSTLQIYLKKLQKEGYLTKTDYNHYEITSKGKNRYYELSKFKKKERHLSYPPKEILGKRNYDHWILWMGFNNNFCKWADFLEEPLSINQSSLSKNMSKLLDDGYIKKEEKKYIITQLGKLQYSKILKYYDLDRQTILEEESKRIKGITKNTIKFFEKHRIQDKSVQFRYLNNLLKLPYETVKLALEDKVDFHKVLLYLSINHPSQYPNYISPEEFSQKYNINLIKLKFALLRIVDENIYPIKFFKINIAPNQYYYFQVNEKLEKMLNAIVEDYITQYTYLYHLYEENSNDHNHLSIELILDEILDETCGSLFDVNLRDNLRAFLPRYIDYLAYKVKEEKPLVGIYDKLESLIWQNIKEIIHKKTNGGLGEDFVAQIKEIDEKIEQDPMNLEFYQLKIGILLNNDQYQIVLNLIDEMIDKFPKQEIDLKLKKAMVLKNLRQIDRGLEIINDLIKRNPKEESLLSYKAYWMQYLDEENEAIKIMQHLVDKNPSNSMYHDTYGEILMNFKKYSKATTEFLKTIDLGPGRWFIYQTYIKLGICYKELEDYESAVTFINKGISLAKTSHADSKSKKNWLSIANLFLEQISYENQDFQ